MWSNKSLSAVESKTVKRINSNGSIGAGHGQKHREDPLKSMCQTIITIDKVITQWQNNAVASRRSIISLVVLRVARYAEETKNVYVSYFEKSRYDIHDE